MSAEQRQEIYAKVQESADRLDRSIVTLRSILRDMDRALAALSIEWWQDPE